MELCLHSQPIDILRYVPHETVSRCGPIDSDRRHTNAGEMPSPAKTKRSIGVLRQQASLQALRRKYLLVGSDSARVSVANPTGRVIPYRGRLE